MENSKIEWTHHTFNPWIGCTKVSEGCKNCYAEELMDKRYGRVKWGVHGLRVRTSKSNWKQPNRWNKAAKEAGVRARVFCASLADIFEDKPDQQELSDWRRDLFELIINTPYLDWLLLTKRPENVNRLIEKATGFSDAETWFCAAQNVWIGTSVENQEQANIRIPELLEIPATVRFLSCEPLLGEVDISDCMPVETIGGVEIAQLIDWVIAGGESGHHARPMHPDWVRSLRGQCNLAGIPFFFKQWGEWLPGMPIANTDGTMSDFVAWQSGVARRAEFYCDNVIQQSDGTVFAKVGKKSAGRLLDGREWNEFPEVKR